MPFAFSPEAHAIDLTFITASLPVARPEHYSTTAVAESNFILRLHGSPEKLQAGLVDVPAYIRDEDTPMQPVELVTMLGFCQRLLTAKQLWLHVDKSTNVAGQRVKAITFPQS